MTDFNHKKYQEIFSSLQNIITDIILLCDLDHTILASNRAADIILGKGEKVRGYKCFDVLKKRNSSCDDCPLAATLESGKILPYSYYDKDLNEYFEERLFPVTNNGGKPEFYIATCRNISATKAIENKSSQVKRLSALGRISSGVAHDFNNILTIISGRINMLQKYAGNDDMQRHIHLIKKAIYDGSEKIRGIQDFAKHKSDEKKVTINLRELLLEVKDITEPKWKIETLNQGIIIEPILTLDTNIFIKGIKSDLRNCFANIIFNAIDAMPDGGLIKISSRGHNNFAHIIFRDTGIGMTDEVKEKIFDPFFTTKGESGTGMGMSEVYGIIKRHNGFISVDSTIGVGTTITIKMPALELTGHQSSVDVSNNFSEIAVISISENEVQQELIQNICSDYEVNLKLYKNYDKAFESFRKIRPRIFITNLKSPEMKGLKIAQQVKQHKRNTITVLIPEIILSQDEHNLFCRTFDHIISPPLTRDKINIYIKKIIHTVRDDRNK